MCHVTATPARQARIGKEKRGKSRSNEGGDIGAIAPQLIEQLSEVRRGLDQHQQYGVGRQTRQHGQSVLEFEYCREQCATLGGGTEFIGILNDIRNVCRHVFGINVWKGLAIDQQAVAAENYCGLNAITLPNRRDKIANGGHGPLRMWKIVEVYAPAK